MERKKTTKHIGSLKGKLLIFGGVYSNLQALQRLQSIAEDMGIAPSNIICTGDIVGYCAQPEEVVQLVKSWGIRSIAGNVEIQLREGAQDCGCDFTEGGRCDGFSKEWYPYAQNALSADSIQWMHSLPDFLQFEYGSKKVSVVHGSYFHTSEFIFKSTPWISKKLNFAPLQSDVILSGHCGIPFNDCREELYWLNPGVVGMPANDGSPKVWYMLMEYDANHELTFSHERFGYNHRAAAQQMNENNLTPAYAKTLLSGIWDNCEILPEEETLRQGKPIELQNFPSGKAMEVSINQLLS